MITVPDEHRRKYKHGLSRWKFMEKEQFSRIGLPVTRVFKKIAQNTWVWTLQFT